MPIAGKDQLADTFYPIIDDLQELETFQSYNDSVLSSNHIFIQTLAMDFSSGTSLKERKEIDEKWKQEFPKLKHVKILNLRHKVTQDYFEEVCKMENLEALNMWTSTVTDIKSIAKLKNLKALSLSNLSKLEDISPLVKLEQLQKLSIRASFKIKNFEIIGEMNWLRSLTLGGDEIAPRNLMLSSLKPFAGLDQLIELDFSYTSIRDKNYKPILELKKLKRLDAFWRMKNQDRESLLNEHPFLRSGFFIAYDFDKNEFKEGVEWWIE